MTEYGTINEAAKAWDKDPRRIREMFSKDQRQDTGKGGNARYLYPLPSGSTAAAPAAVGADPKDEDDPDYEMSEKFFVDHNTKRYVFFLPSKRKPFAVPIDVVDAMISAYTDADGAPDTWEGLASTHGMRKQTIVEILKALDITKKSPPWSREKMEGMKEEEMYDDLIRMKAERVRRKAEQAEWRKVKQDAYKWQHLELSMRDLVETMPSRKMQKIPKRFKKAKEERLYVVHATDFHYGKYGYAGEVGEHGAYDCEIARTRLHNKTSELLAKMQVHGSPEELLIPVGGDWVHIDREDKGPTTTAGTPQQADGSLTRILDEAIDLAIDHVDMLLTMGPKVARLVLVRGNHDWVITMMLIRILEKHYRANKNVIVEVAPNVRQYVTFGTNVFCVTHGNRISEKDLVNTCASEFPEWSSHPHRFVLTGDLHHHRFTEYKGNLLIRCPTLAGADSWHHNAGYVGNKQTLACYLFNKETGLDGHREA